MRGIEFVRDHYSFGGNGIYGAIVAYSDFTDARVVHYRVEISTPLLMLNVRLLTDKEYLASVEAALPPPYDKDLLSEADSVGMGIEALIAAYVGVAVDNGVIDPEDQTAIYPKDWNTYAGSMTWMYVSAMVDDLPFRLRTQERLLRKQSIRVGDPIRIGSLNLRPGDDICVTGVPADLEEGALVTCRVRGEVLEFADMQDVVLSGTQQGCGEPAVIAN